jgi:DNA-binding NtrC family response regulator
MACSSRAQLAVLSSVFLIQKVRGAVRIRQAGILLVGENSLWLRTHEYGLRTGGHAVWVANAARDALHLYDAHWEAIDIVLVDAVRSVLNTAAILAALRQINPDVSCCVVVTDVDANTESCFLEAGAARVFQKPMRLAEFDEIIAELARTRLQQQAVLPLHQRR